MEKFANFTKITDEFLNGKLEELSINYDGNNHLKVSVTYEDDTNFWLDYLLEVNLTSQVIHFIAHHIKGSLDKVELARELEFEKAVGDFLFSNVHK